MNNDQVICQYVEKLHEEYPSALIRFANPTSDPLVYNFEYLLVELYLVKAYLLGDVTHSYISVRPSDGEEGFGFCGVHSTISLESTVGNWNGLIAGGQEVKDLKSNLLLEAVVEKILNDEKEQRLQNEKYVTKFTEKKSV